MNKVDYLKMTFAEKAFNEKAFLQAMLSIQLEDPESSGLFKQIPKALYLEGGKYWYLEGTHAVPVDHQGDAPLFYIDEPLSLPGDFHPCLQGKAIETTFGIFLFNVVLLWEVFGPLIPYHNDEFTKNFICDILREIMCDNPAEGETVPEGKASVDTCMRFSEHCNFLEGLGLYFIRCSSVEALTVSKEVLALRDKLFAENKDKLHDPVVFTAIVDQVVALDYELQMKGPSRTFYIEKKFIDNSRKRMFIAFGAEFNAEEGRFVSLTKSLEEGWDTNEMANYINTAIEGSYNRGKATGEGGARVKETLRLVGRVRADNPDCRSPVGEVVTITKASKGWWTGSYYINSKGEAVLITKENVDSLLDKPLRLRAPQFCIEKDGNYCKTCLGSGLGKYSHRVSADVVREPTNMMLSRMKAVHTAGMSNTKLNLKAALQR